MYKKGRRILKKVHEYSYGVDVTQSLQALLNNPEVVLQVCIYKLKCIQTY